MVDAPHERTLELAKETAAAIFEDLDRGLEPEKLLEIWLAGQATMAAVHARAAIEPVGSVERDAYERARDILEMAVRRVAYEYDGVDPYGIERL